MQISGAHASCPPSKGVVPGEGVRSPFGEHKFTCFENSICPHAIDRKSTRLNSSHVSISYAVFCLKKKKDSNIIGRTLRLNGEAYTVLGVMPREIKFAPFCTTKAELWAPLALRPRHADRGGASLRV